MWVTLYYSACDSPLIYPTISNNETDQTFWTYLVCNFCITKGKSNDQKFFLMYQIEYNFSFDNNAYIQWNKPNQICTLQTCQIIPVSGTSHSYTLLTVLKAGGLQHDAFPTNEGIWPSLNTCSYFNFCFHCNHPSLSCKLAWTSRWSFAMEAQSFALPKNNYKSKVALWINKHGATTLAAT